MILSVNAHAPTDTKGKRISVLGTNHKRRYYPWDFSKDAAANFRSAAMTYANELLGKAGYPLDTPVFSAEFRDKNGTIVGFQWD